MLSKLLTTLDKAERKLRYSFGKDITDPRQRRLSTLHYHVFDHAFLRIFWTNFWQIAPGVYRSNQPTHGRFETYAKMGIKTVINLRGEDKRAQYLFEKESCEALGLTLVNAKLWARSAAKRHRIEHVIDVLRAAERPMMFHCKSGADRAGFVAAMYLMVFEGKPVEEARKMLGLKYIHLKATKTGVQDYILDIYAARNARAPIGFEQWIRTEYAGGAIQKAYEAGIPPDKVELPT
ncbi:fused DSP-PTPase phosphatase/NAD kinase-like protein [Aestuariicoccus sp. MJ-SS9]|uniref:fused DSP-PTPase phosphatase/NAD kinase-like protein n=1 Tax=Aestuariicoccus sp. MJ-SS9 TaxID=3079855 RepID=UPI00290F5DF4|nr:tyrosine-protein phosphatase [Aestuariicoccus sp. MJ-SS9]MDU8912808.1 tyrosine-protein phosphatase [Aestuariicoccus sp. MJ-SS9]